MSRYLHLVICYNSSEKIESMAPTCPGERMRLNYLFGETIFNSYAVLGSWFNDSWDTFIFPFSCIKVQMRSARYPFPCPSSNLLFPGRHRDLCTQVSGGCLMAQQTLHFTFWLLKKCLGIVTFLQDKLLRTNVDFGWQPLGTSYVCLNAQNGEYKLLDKTFLSFSCFTFVSICWVLQGTSTVLGSGYVEIKC